MSKDAPTQSVTKPVEVPVSERTAGDVAQEAHSSLVNEYMKETPTQRSPEQLNGNGSVVPNKDFTDKYLPIPEKTPVLPRVTDIINKQDRSVSDILKQFEGDPALAKRQFADAINKSVSPEDQPAMKDIQNALFEGKIDKLGEALKGLSPEKRAELIKTLNENLDKYKLDTNLTLDSKGNVIVYNDRGNSAVSINPDTGETSLRPIERQTDGSILLKSGEIINRSAADLFSDIGRRLTHRAGLSALGLQQHHLLKPPLTQPRREYPIMPERQIEPNKD